jgi:hypothetical protein
MNREKVELECGRIAELLEQGSKLTIDERIFTAALLRMGIELADDLITLDQFYDELAEYVSEEG